MKFVEEIINNLLKDYKIRFRPHKTSFKYHSKQISKIVKTFKNNKNFIFDLDDNSFDYILNAKYFITDWSGSSFEYSFFTLRPVIFMETPLKVNNLDYKKIDYAPKEVSMREKMGIILKKNEINNLREKFSKIDFEIKKYNDNILELRNSLLFNFGKSSKKEKIFLREILNEI